MKSDTSLLNTASVIIAEKTKTAAERMRQAIELFDAGDNAGAYVALDSNVIEADAARNLEIHRLAKKIMDEVGDAIMSNIDEYRLKAKSVLALADNENRFDEAAQYYQQAIDLAEEGEVYPQVYVGLLDELSDIFCEEGKYKEAIKLYNEIIWALIENANLDFECGIDIYQNKIGLAYFALDDYDEALKWFSQALDHLETFDAGLSPNTVATYLNIGDVYKASGEFDKALESFFKALKVQEEIPGREYPHPEYIYRGIAVAYEAKGDLDKAAAYYLKSAQLGCEEAKQWLLNNRPYLLC